MNKNTLIKIGFGLSTFLIGWCIAAKKNENELKDILGERERLLKEQSDLIDEMLKSADENIKIRDEIIDNQRKIINKLDPDLAKKLNKAESDLHLVKD